MKFKLWCIANGYTAAEIAELTGMSVKSIFAYWQDVRKPSRETEKRLKEVLDIPSGLFD